MPDLPAKDWAKLLIGDPTNARPRRASRSDGICCETSGKNSLALDVVWLVACSSLFSQTMLTFS